MFIRSERLFLRPGWPEDRDELYRAMADRAVVANLATAPWPYSPEDARRFLERPALRGLPTFLITLPGPGGARLIGGAGLGRQESGVELGYWIAREVWGHGYASEAGRAILGLARTLGHTRVVASHFADNPASGAVLEKIGFVRTGRSPERISAGRGSSARTLEYAICLEGGDGGGDNDESRGEGNTSWDTRVLHRNAA